MDYRDESSVLQGHSASRDEMAFMQSPLRPDPRDVLRSLKISALPVASEGESEDLTALPRQSSLASPHSTDNSPEDPNSPVSMQEKKRKRLAEQHNKSEQRRRKKINAKLDELQSMVPFSRSREKAAILLDVIEYIKSVQAQLHIMSAITACDYAAYQAPPAESFLQPIGLAPPGHPLSPTSIMPPTMASSGGGIACGMVPGPGSAMPSFGHFGLSSASGGGEVRADHRKTGGNGGWSLSSGESSAHLGGATVDTTTANSYDPLIF